VRHRAKGAVVGLDLSLRAPACVVIPSGWRLGDWSQLGVLTWQTALPEPGFRPRYERIVNIRDRILARIGQLHAVGMPRVFIEDYAFASPYGREQLAELGGVVKVGILDRYGLESTPVASAAWRRLLLGKVPRKDAKIVTHRALYAVGAGSYLTTGDACDAFGVANYGLSELGLTALSLA
jgi:hypothetical protein